jgi:hypothetical protein
MANLNSGSYHSLIGFLTPEYLEFLKWQVVPRLPGTGTCISPVSVNRNRGILTSLISTVGPITYKVVSSAYISNFVLSSSQKISGRSLQNMENKLGPSTEPWGTPKLPKINKINAFQVGLFTFNAVKIHYHLNLVHFA